MSVRLNFPVYQASLDFQDSGKQLCATANIIVNTLRTKAMSIFSKIPSGNAGNSVKEAFDTASNTVDTEILNTVIETNTLLIQRQSNARAAVQQANAETDSLRARNKKLQSRLDDVESDLAEQAEVLKSWMASYEEQKSILKEWAISQLAFKELALQYGLDNLNKNREEVINEYRQIREKVMNNSTKHGNNIDSIKI